MDRLRSVAKIATSYSRCRCVKLMQKRNVATTSTPQYKWEPDDLKLEPDVPLYDSLLVKLQGFDYRVLETFQQFVYSKAKGLDIDCRRFPVPAKKMEYKVLQFNSSLVKDNVHLDYYERDVQLYDVNTLQVPIFLNLICPHTPEGVSITVKETTPEDEEFVYVLDQDKQKIMDLMDTLEEQRG